MGLTKSWNSVMEDNWDKNESMLLDVWFYVSTLPEYLPEEAVEQLSLSQSFVKQSKSLSVSQVN